MTCVKGLIPIESYGPLIIRSCMISWQIETIMSPLPQCLWPPNLEGWWSTLKGSFPLSLMALKWRGLLELRDESKTYLQY